MKTALILAGLMGLAWQARSQTKADTTAFREAWECYERDKEGSLMRFYEFLTTYPKSQLRGSAHFNIGWISRELKRNDAAKAAFKGILAGDYNEMDPNGLMEVYKLYKHRSARELAEIYLEEENFKEAAKYIKVFDEEYPYQHFCGNELMAYDIYRATMYAQLYHGLGRDDEAIRILIPYSMDNSLASNQPVLERLFIVLNAKYTQVELYNLMNTALESIVIKETKKRTKAWVDLFGVKVEVASDWSDSKHDLAYYKGELRSSELFVRYLGPVEGGRK